MPLALGWDSSRSVYHPFAIVWVVCEVLLIGAVSAIYWLGHQRDWQGQWLRARTTAELTWYLPMLAPLLDFTSPHVEANWYVRVLEPGQHLRKTDDLSTLCVRVEPLARQLLSGAWSDSAFVNGYTQWTLDILEQQRRYHRGVAAKQHALRHRVHSINATLFGLTASGHCFIWWFTHSGCRWSPRSFQHWAPRFTAHWHNPKPTGSGRLPSV